MEISDLLLDRIAQRLKAMGNAKRLRILHTLEEGEQSVKQLVAIVGDSQANVSKHLNVLRTADLVKRRRDGVTVYYRMSDREVLAICHTVCDSLHLQAHQELESIKAGRTAVQEPSSSR